MLASNFDCQNLSASASFDNFENSASLKTLLEIHMNLPLACETCFSSLEVTSRVNVPIFPRIRRRGIGVAFICRHADTKLACLRQEETYRHT